MTRNYHAEIAELDRRIADADRDISILSFRQVEGENVTEDMDRARAKHQALTLERDTLTRALAGLSAKAEDEAKALRRKTVKENRQLGREKVKRLKVLAKRVDAMAAEFGEVVRELHQIDHDMRGIGIRGEFMFEGKMGQGQLSQIARLHLDRVMAKDHEKPDRSMVESAMVAWSECLTLPDEVE